MNKRPMHGYEIQQILQKSQVHLWTKIQTNSIYHALRQMEKEGLIEEFHKETAGKRVRVVYTITEDGVVEFKSLFEKSLKQPTTNVPSGLYTSLSFLNDFSTHTVIELTDEHVNELKRVISNWEEGVGVDKGFDDASLESSLYHLILQNGIDHMKTDIKLLEDVIKILKERM